MMKFQGLTGRKVAQAPDRYCTCCTFILLLMFLILIGPFQSRVLASADPNDPNQTNEKDVTGDLVENPSLEKLILQLVDSDGNSVEGAKVGTSVTIHDTDMLNLKENRFRWFLRRMNNKNISDENGQITLLKEQLLQINLPGEPEEIVYFFHESRRIGAFISISSDDFPGRMKVTLVPLCRVHGKIGSEGLDALGRPLASVRVFLGPNWNLQYMGSSLNRFEFLVPPREYVLTVDCANTKDFWRKIKVDPEVAELDIGTIDLQPNALEDLIGKPAPKIGPIKEWEDHQPVKLADLKGKVVLLYFGGSYPDTMFALPKLVELHNYYADKGLVIIALYTVDSLKPIRDKLNVKFGGVSGPAFRLAIDGGKGRYINNTLMPGATHATYEVGIWSTNVLINQEGCVERLVDLRQAAEVVGQMLDVEVPAWLKNCKNLYRLEDDQVLKHIAPPFLPQRREYFESLNPRLAKIHHSGPNGMIFRGDDEPVLWGLISRRSLNLGDIIEYVLDVSDPNYYRLSGSNSLEEMTELHNPDPVGFERLLNMPVSGDWILRHKVPLEEKVKALEKLISDEFGQPVRIEKRTVVQDFIVVTGNFEFSPVYSNREICLYSGPGEIDRPTGEMFLGEVNSLEEFLQRLGYLVGMPVINNTGSIEDFSIPFRAHLGRPSLRNTKDLTKLKMQRMKFLLEGLGKQTNLKFRMSRRPIDVWRVEEAQGN